MTENHKPVSLQDIILDARQYDPSEFVSVQIGGVSTIAKPVILDIIADSEFKNCLAQQPNGLIHIGAGYTPDEITHFLRELTPLLIEKTAGLKDRFRLIKELCLLESEWCDPKGRGPYSVAHRGYKDLGLSEFTVRVFLTRFRSEKVIMGVRYDKKYGLELEFTFAGGLEEHRSMLENIQTEALDEAALHYPQEFRGDLKSLGKFDTLMTREIGVRHNVNHLYRGRLKSGAYPEPSKTEHMYGFAEFSPQELMGYLTAARRSEHHGGRLRVFVPPQDVKERLLPLNKSDANRLNRMFAHHPAGTDISMKSEVPTALVIYLADRVFKGRLSKELIENPRELLTLASERVQLHGTMPYALRRDFSVPRPRRSRAPD